MLTLQILHRYRKPNICNLAAEGISYSTSTLQRFLQHARNKKKLKLHTVTHRLREKMLHSNHFKRQKVPRFFVRHTGMSHFSKKILFIGLQVPLFIQEICANKAQAVKFLSSFTQLNAQRYKPFSPGEMFWMMFRLVSIGPTVRHCFNYSFPNRLHISLFPPVRKLSLSSSIAALTWTCAIRLTVLRNVEVFWYRTGIRNLNYSAALLLTTPYIPKVCSIDMYFTSVSKRMQRGRVSK